MLASDVMSDAIVAADSMKGCHAWATASSGGMLALCAGCAKMTLAALRSEATVGQTLTLAGPGAWTVPEVITLCEKFADENANVTEVLQSNRPTLGNCI